MNTPRSYSYMDSLKSGTSDELVNTYLIRPIAGILVRTVYPTKITPNQLTLASIFFGLVAAGLYFQNAVVMTQAAGLCVIIKDIFDSADGQLARARGESSRMGRFLDSIGDFLVNVVVLAALTYTIVTNTGNAFFALVGLAGFFGISLRVSYHVFYHAMYLHLHGKYEANRVSEAVTRDDQSADTTTLILQNVFQLLYGWQDRMMHRLDLWCRRSKRVDEAEAIWWYADPTALRLSRMMGLGTELFFLTVCSLFDAIETYLYLNLFLMNGIWLAGIVYRRFVLAPALQVR